MSAAPYDDAERTRRIQEEIRRKIAERRSGRLPPTIPSRPTERPLAPPVLAPRPVARADGGLRERLGRKLAELREKAEAAAAAQRKQEQVETQRRVQATEQVAAQRRVADAVVARDALAVKKEVAIVAAKPLPNRWRAELRDPASVRRAMVLREILGTPVGLR